MSWVDLFLIVVALVVGLVAGMYIEEQDAASRPTTSFLDYDPGLAAREACSDIAADVRRAEEEIRRVSEPSRSGGS